MESSEDGVVRDEGAAEDEDDAVPGAAGEADGDVAPEGPRVNTRPARSADSSLGDLSRLRCS